MIDSQKILYGESNDERYTPKYAVTPLLKYIPNNWVIWCPFDTEDSEYVKEISKTNKVICSHINNGEDFFKYEPTDQWDCIISNPPFKNKRKFFERAMEFRKPFALLMTLTCLNDKYPMWSFYERRIQPQILKFDRRVHFLKPDGSVDKKTTFQSGYICCGFLPKDLILDGLNK